MKYAEGVEMLGNTRYSNYARTDRPRTGSSKGGRKRREDMVRRDRGRSAPAVNRNVGEDASRLLAEVTPGKKGGTFSLPFGGLVTAPPGVFGKKDVVTCCMASPGDRYKYQPPIKPGEHMLSEVFLVATSIKNMKKPLSLRLPFVSENTDVYDTSLLMRRMDGDEWAAIEAKFVHNELMVEFDVTSGGVFVVTSYPRTERFDILAQGCLYSAKIHHQMSLRFAKKATETDLPCDIRILPLNRDVLPCLRREYPLDMSEMLTMSDFYDIVPSVHREFRRAATIKLPLPQLDNDSSEFPEADVAVLRLVRDTWEVMETPLKFTKNSVSFDTKTLHRFCVAIARPQRRRRLGEALRHVHVAQSMRRGDVLPFIHIQEKLWTLWLDVVAWDKDVIEQRQRQGFRRIRIQQLPLMEEPEPEFIPRGRHRSAKVRTPAEPKPDRDDLDLVSGESFDLEISGDIKLSEEEPVQSDMRLLYHDRLPQNYRRYFIEPLPIPEGRILTGFLKCWHTTPDGRRTCLRTFDFDVQPEAVQAYFYVEPDPEPEPEPVRLIPDIAEEPPETPLPKKEEVTEKKPRPVTASFLRLTQLVKPPREIFKEPRVLSGRSLMCVAREVEQGLTLAIHLDISDSAITGMGFDALANGLSLVDITYRILLLWKRRTKKYKEKQVSLLTGALQEMGRTDIAAIITDRHQQNLDITHDCFEATAAE